MEPQLASPESLSGNPPEGVPDSFNHEQLPTSSESLIESPEHSKSAEQLLINHQGPTAPIVQQQAAIPVQDNSSPQGATVISATPTSAKDDDLIEKEWISKVKSVISSTADDPHKQQSMMSRLMADYVLKRYNRKIGEAER